jgi:hypothetical protein
VDIVVIVKNLFGKNPLNSVEILSPEANLSSSHTTKTTSFRRYGIAEAYTARDFLLKTGLKSEFGSVEPEQGVAKSNWLYAVPSDIYLGLKWPQVTDFHAVFVSIQNHVRNGFSSPN